MPMIWLHGSFCTTSLLASSHENLALGDYQIKVDPPATKGDDENLPPSRFFQRHLAFPGLVTTDPPPLRRTRLQQNRPLDQRRGFSTGMAFFSGPRTWGEETSPLPSIRAAHNSLLPKRGREKGLCFIEHDRRGTPENPVGRGSAAKKLPRRFPHTYGKTIHCEPMHRSCSRPVEQ